MMCYGIENETFVRGKLYGIIITYFPDESVVRNIMKALKYYSFIIIIDNTEAKNNVLSTLSSNKNIDIVYNMENLGIAKAIEIGIIRAKNLGATWVTTFDQDSVLMLNYPLMIETFMDMNLNKQQHIIFGCRPIEPSDHEANKSASDSILNGFVSTDEIITSGMTFSLKTWNMLNGLDTSFFIDFVDHEFCAKARRNKVQCLITKKPVLVHSLGHISKHNFFWKKIVTSNHSPLRRYYMARNTIAYIKKYIYVFPGLSIKHFYKLIREQIIIVLFEKQKSIKICYFLKGILDGTIGKMGKF